MNYYKIMADNVVVDVNNEFLRYQQKHKVMLVCRPEEAQFVWSSDHQEIWRVEWLNDIPEELEGRYNTVKAIEITEKEYNIVREQLDAGNITEEETEGEPEQVEETEKAQNEERVMSTAEMRRCILELTKQLQEQKEHNAMLEDCVLEMSEIVYA